MNFDHPYSRDAPPSSGGAGTSRCPRWFRDYVYIPLGGNRGTEVARPMRNLMVTFVLGGLLARRELDFRALGRLSRRSCRLQRIRGGLRASGHRVTPRVAPAGHA